MTEKSVMPVTLEELRRVGEGIHGHRWQRPLAKDLHVNDRTLRRWVSLQWRMPANLRERLQVVILEKMKILHELRGEL